MKYVYVPIPEAEVPPNIRFDVPGPFQGQAVELAWGTFSRAEASAGAPYKRVTDLSCLPSSPCRVQYFRRVHHSSHVVTYQSPSGSTIRICDLCGERLRGEWPKDGTGQEYCSVSKGSHWGNCDIEIE